MGNYAEIHLHSMDSNVSMVEVVTKVEQYLDKAKELGLTGMVVTNHGVLTGWYNNKKKIEEAGLKYVHGVESYITWTLDEKVRDNFHLSLYAKNYDGFKELNKMVSKSFNREDGHYYYNPRISWEEIKATSDNIIISTACLGGLMWKLDEERRAEVIDFLSDNKHRVFLEVQPHQHEEQVALNKRLSSLSKETGIPLIAGGDVHALDQSHDDTRKVLQKSKNICFENEDSFDLTMKSYEERVRMFELQGALSHEEILTALKNTNVLIDMVEPFELDYSNKYPKVVEGDSLEIFKQKINEGIIKRGIDKYPIAEKKVYAERINHELEAFIANGAVDYMLLEDLVKSHARKMNVPYGYGRGSASGSIIAFLMQITEMDSIKHNLNFERFMSKERISLSDIDTDYSPQKRHIVQEFVINGIEGVYSAPIMTANTMALKGAIRDIGRGLDMSLDEVDMIAKGIDDREEEYRMRYPELFKHVDICQGVITSIGQHACFEEDVLVSTFNGYKKIKDIVVGDEVLTHNNRFMPVVETMITNSEDIYKLRVGSAMPVKVTGNHPMYIREAKIFRSRKGGIDVRKRQWGEPQWKNVSDIDATKHWIGIAINNESIIPSYEKYKHLPFDNKDFWWLVGRYLGDGWTEYYGKEHKGERNKNGRNERRTIICCSQSGEYKDIQEVLTRLSVLESTGMEFNNRLERARTTYKFHIGSKSNHELYDYLQTFGRYAHGKHLNGDVLNLPVELLESFLNGYFSADGSYNEKVKTQSFKTVSKELAVGISSCVNKVYKRHVSIGIIPSKTEFVEGRKVNSKEKYNVVFTVDTREKERSFYEEGYIWSRVSCLEKLEEVRDMYNLTVLDDSSYTVNNMIAHNCGIVVSPIPLDEHMGLITTSESEYPLTMINMKEIDAQNFVKLDVLSLDGIQIIANTCELAGIDYLTPNNVDFNNEAVWQSIREDNTNIFQFESDFAKQIFQDLFSKSTIDKIRSVNPNFSYLDLASLGNAILRPAGASYRNDVIQGNFYDNGHEALNEFLAPTLGRLVYQEQLISFLVIFCQYSAGQADLIRRGVGKKSKEIMDVEVPKIKEAFVKTMIEKYDTTEEHAREIIEPFMQVFIDSANYGFSINHSEAYSCISYIMGWLRYHYPLEFLTACLNANIGKEDKINKLIDYAKSQGVKIKPIDYGFSKADFMFDKEEYAIYQGVEGIKYLNEQVGNGLYEFKQKYGKHDNFFDFLIELEDGVYHSNGIYDHDEEEGIERELFPPVEPMSALRVLKGEWEEVLTYEKMKKIGYVNDKGFSINSRQMKILISLNYFKEFGENKTLLDMYEFYEKNYKVGHKLKTKVERHQKLMDYYNDNSSEQKKLSLNEQSIAEMDYLGHVVTIREDMKKNVYFVSSITKNKQNVRVFAYQYATGKTFEFKASNRVYNLTPVMGGDIIEIQDISIKPKTVKVGDSWVKSPTEKTFWVEQMKYIRKNRG